MRSRRGKTVHSLSVLFILGLVFICTSRDSWPELIFVYGEILERREVTRRGLREGGVHQGMGSSVLVTLLGHPDEEHSTYDGAIEATWDLAGLDREVLVRNAWRLRA